MFCFWGFHTVSHDILSDNVSFHSMHIEDTLHKSDSLYFFISGNSGIRTSNYTKAILISSGKNLRVKLTPSNLYFIVKLRFEGFKYKNQ